MGLGVDTHCVSKKLRKHTIHYEERRGVYAPSADVITFAQLVTSDDVIKRNFHPFPQAKSQFSSWMSAVLVDQLVLLLHSGDPEMSEH